MSAPLLADPAASHDPRCPEDTEARLRDRAYRLWEEAGCPNGREHEFWAKASAEIEREQGPAEPVERIVAR